MPGRRHARAAVIATTVAWCVDARRVRFCCKTEMGATALGDPQCGRQDLVFVGNRFPAAALDAKVVFELVLGVSSNLCFYFPLRLLAARSYPVQYPRRGGRTGYRRVKRVIRRR